MEALAQVYGGSSLTSGVVRAREGDALLVAGPFGLVRARRADGCLLQPEPRDAVLLALLDDGDAWVLSVLRRADACASGELRLPARTRLHTGELSLSADDLRLSGRVVSVRAGLLTLGGRLLLQGFAAVRTLNVLGIWLISLAVLAVLVLLIVLLVRRRKRRARRRAEALAVYVHSVDRARRNMYHLSAKSTRNVQH